MDGKKINTNQDNPIDYGLIEISEKISPELRKLNFTPNIITTIGLFFGLLAVYFIWKGYTKSAFIFFWLGFFCDCLDGYYARKYNMMSKFGSYYDVARDWIVTVSIILILFFRIKSRKLKVVYVVVTIIFSILLSVHMGCQEKNTHDHKQSETLSFTKNLCPNKDDIYITRFFGCGTFILVQSIFILLV